MEVYFATTNSGKIQSLQRVLDNYGVFVVQAAIEIPEPRSDDVSEIADGKRGVQKKRAVEKSFP